jgi:hypothetical protein
MKPITKTSQTSLSADALMVNLTGKIISVDFRGQINANNNEVKFICALCTPVSLI